MVFQLFGGVLVMYYTANIEPFFLSPNFSAHFFLFLFYIK